MKNVFILFYLVSFLSFSQKQTVAFKDGEFLKYRINYGILNAGLISLETNTYVNNSESFYHVIGKGWSTGIVNFFFSVNDDYQSYIHQLNNRPYHFIRKINEGGYTKNKEIFFDFQNNQAQVIDHKHNSEKNFTIQNDVQDMLSSLYYLRSLNLDGLKEGDSISIKMFFDEKTYPVKLNFKGREIIKTTFGKVNTLVFKPKVQEGRIFKEDESVTIWISDDKNKIPIKIKADILVGSIKAELILYKGLANPFPIIFN